MVALKSPFIKICHLFIISSLYLIIRTPLLDKPLQHDEIYNTSAYLQDCPLSKTSQKHALSNALNLSWGTDWKRQITMHPPFLSGFYYFWIRIFGDSEISLHAPVIIAGLAGIILLYLLGSLLFGNDVGFLAALGVSFSVAHIEYSTQAVHAIFEPFILLASLLCIYGFITTRRRKFFYSLILANIFGILIYYHYYVYLIIQTIILRLLRKELKITRIYFVSVAAITVLFAFFTLTNFAKGSYSYEFWIQSNIKTLINTVISLPSHIIR